ncbi:hypothetical protein ACJX0J_005739 [Zea mays]
MPIAGTTIWTRGIGAGAGGEHGVYGLLYGSVLSFLPIAFIFSFLASILDFVISTFNSHTTTVLSPLGMIDIFPNYSYCFYVGEVYVIVHILSIVSFVLAWQEKVPFFS